jgi:hypothetical protein
MNGPRQEAAPSDGEVHTYAHLEMGACSRKRITKMLCKDALNLNGIERHWQDWITQQQNTLKTQFMGALQSLSKDRLYVRD